jgi:subtilisin family serine protease
MVSKSFIFGQTVQDGYGHGTHCIGTACGPKQPATGVRRYGIAYAAAIHVGKVLSNQGSGGTGGIVAGIEWAVVGGCQVISMSLGANVNQKLQQYEVPIERALKAGSLVVAAAGNNAQRSVGVFGFVTPPANANAALAVAALTNQLRVADFSARSSTVTGVGGKVNIAGPGVEVFSSVPVNLGTHGMKNGTSMATPHVSGVAALWCQATGERGAALWARLEQAARPLGMPIPAVDVGSGLVQAP